MSSSMRKITRINNIPAKSLRRKRVSAYARVSSGKDAMLQSLSAQVSYYNKYIQQRGDWEFAGIYADEAISGTKDMRAEFQRMLKDCRDGKIDMIITKSITRFARNTVILLETVRELKLLGIDVFFEKENIHSISADGEFMITLLASYAQEESRSVSENQKWRIRRMFEKGRPNTGRMLGYRLFDGKLYILSGEAEIVRRIFVEYLSGKGRLAIAKGLNADGLRTINNVFWRESSIMCVLCNEKYTGDMLLQKTYISDPISKQAYVNRGELPMYHVVDSHEAIIDKSTFEKVQQEISRRSADGRKKAPNKPVTYPFTGLLRCGVCGGSYRRKHTAIGTKYDKIVWICNTFNSLGKNMCASRQIPEPVLMKKANEVLGFEEFDATVFRAQVREIGVLPHNRLRFILQNGNEIVIEWQNASRRESWTDEMKQVARERQNTIIDGRKKDE